MKKIKLHLISLLFLFYSVNAFSQIRNFDFEYKDHLKWFLINEDDHSDDVYQQDSIECISGNASLRIEIKDKDSKFAGVSQFINVVDNYLDKKIILSGYIKTNELFGFAGLWLRIDGENKERLFFDNMYSRKINGNREWSEYNIRTTIPKGAKKIVFGTLMRGVGTAWFDKLSIDIDGENLNDDNPESLMLTNEEKEWFRSKIIPLHSSDFNQNDCSNLSKLNSVFADADIVALGEVSHGSKTIFEFKNSLIKYLIPKYKVSTFSIEAPMAESYRLNDYIIDNKGDPNDLIEGMTFWTWNTEEMYDLVYWMNLYNKKDSNKVSFSGFDMQSYIESLNIVSVFLKDMKDNKFDSDLSYLNDNLGLLKKRKRNKRSDVSYLQKELTDKIKSIEKHISEKYSSYEKFYWIKRNLTILNQFINYSSTVERDKYMADNAEWIFSNKPNTKLILWGHNTHISETSSNMGSYLNKSMGDDKYLSVGFMFYNGFYTAFDIKTKEHLEVKSQVPYPGTYEFFLNSLGEDFFILNLKDLSDLEKIKYKKLLSNLDMRRVGAVKPSKEFTDTNLMENFDLIVFIKNSEASILLD